MFDQDQDLPAPGNFTYLQNDIAMWYLRRLIESMPQLKCFATRWAKQLQIQALEDFCQVISPECMRNKTTTASAWRHHILYWPNDSFWVCCTIGSFEFIWLYIFYMGRSRSEHLDLWQKSNQINQLILQNKTLWKCSIWFVGGNLVHKVTQSTFMAGYLTSSSWSSVNNCEKILKKLERNLTIPARRFN